MHLDLIDTLEIRIRHKCCEPQIWFLEHSQPTITYYSASPALCPQVGVQERWWTELETDNNGHYVMHDLTAVGHASGTGMLDFSHRVEIVGAKK